MAEIPKDYGRLYREDNHTLVSSTNNRPSGGRICQLDGVAIRPQHHEQSIDLRQVVQRLEGLSKESHQAYAIDAVNKHYSSVFASPTGNYFKVYIQYLNEKETYVVRVARNTLKAVKEKLPKKGNFRFFFKQNEASPNLEEEEMDDSLVPFIEKDGTKQIYCRLFAK